MERKLAAIVAGDIVGYTRLMSEDESSTYAALRAAFSELINPLVKKHGGRTFKTTGDGFLATFPSVNEALDAAIEIQNGFVERPFSLRVGINLGDVIEDNGDMFGDGVNVASRLEAMAAPASIFVSEAVVRSADRSRSKLFYSIGRRQAKNIAEPLAVYAVRLEREPAPGRGWLRRMVLRRGAALPVAVGTAGLVVVAAFTQVPALRAIGADLTNGLVHLTGGEPAAGRPAVAVLPFDNMSGEADQAYFADGLTEDIIANLARNPELQVIARNSTFALRGQAEDIRRIGERLGAGYVVEGSARRAGDQLRVVAQLIDARSGAHLWSRTYDRRVEDVFALQTDLTAEIVSHLVSYVRQSEVSNAAERPTENLQAYDLVLKARDRYKHGSNDAESLMAARALLHRALELDPGYAAARANLGMTYIVDFLQNVSGRATRTDVETGLSEARQAVRLDSNLAVGYQVLSFGLSAAGDYAGAMQAAGRAVELNPNDPDSLMALAKAQVRFGSYDEAVRNAERARRLHPMAPEYYTYVYGQALYAAGRLDEADRVLRECLIRAPREADCLLIHTAVLTQRGDVQGARRAMAQLTQVEPQFSLATERANRRFGNSPLMDEFLSQLAEARAPDVTSGVRQRHFRPYL
ncbi:adenylate/guanylate cyclase domain-containing protein [Sinorhizobium alkalisoli]|uniref:adenylate/guanylate cyclase domain-containing protein n=1 Tax=Sinorhizobium alkalisoli TaxID=1752398 RepID=UPI00124CFE0F|nr:adenylate/guanylate cyclase domain-containing protein [Sinorhizobium alkalisoli]MCG5481748.1 tetratricopeptide repeat protein [Sinorhizobium alkalisoli]QFI69439.1 Adenylate cyclase [Sinorhizobium alkalisoli]